MLLSVGACSPGRLIEAGRVLVDVAKPRTERSPSELGPRRIQVGYDLDGRSSVGDLYLPDEQGTGARIVLVPGAAPHGKDDPRLIAFAESLARARFVVLVPDILSVRALQVSASNADDIADAVHPKISSSTC